MVGLFGSLRQRHSSSTVRRRRVPSRDEMDWSAGGGIDLSANTEHELVKGCQPSDRNVKIWRYVNLLVLLTLLQTRSLHFARADTLGDRFEGSLTKLNVAAREQQIRDALAKADPSMGTPEELVSMTRDVTRSAVRCAYVNCWHASEAESQAMWKLYGTATGSVAIQSTYGKLRDVLPERLCLREGSEPDDAWVSDVYLGMVRYRDYGSVVDYVPAGNLMSPFMSKRKELQHERELRAFVFFSEPLVIDLSDGTRFVDRDSMPEGIGAPVDIDRLVETVRVQPGTPPWAKRSIEDLVRKYGWDVKVVASDIDATPLY